MIFNQLSFERAAVGFLLFSATGTSTFARSSMSWDVLLMPILLAALTLVLGLRNKVRFSRPFIFLVICYFLLFLVQLLIFGSYHPKHLVLYPLNFWIAYCFVRAMHERFLFHLEFIITRLASINLIIWGVDAITSGAVRQLFSGITVGQPYNDIVDSYIVLHTFINDGVDSFLPRNSGFAWEPGAFAVFCCVGLIVNIYRTNFRLKNNVGLIILTLAIVSSQSTTGFSILLIFILSKLWIDRRGSTRIFLPIFVATLVASAFTLPFMRDKVVDLWDENLYELARSATSEWNVNQPIAAQRFLSFRVDFSDFLDNPFTGYGGRNGEGLVEREALNIITISGIGKIMAKFGILGLGFFLWSTVLSSRWFGRQFGVRSPMLLTLFVTMVSISYSLIEHPLFLSIWAYWFFGYSGNKTSTEVQQILTTRKKSQRTPANEASYY